ncbi:MAG: rod shape-determining protein, partial [Clostridia bacterium]|nr:rod shape-determining protein [Clostridia bacterium]
KDNIIDKFNLNYISALVAVPCAMDLQQLYKLKTVLRESGINKVNFVQNGVCVREYDESLDAYSNCLVVDIGKYTTDFSILNKFEFRYGRDYSIGGANMDENLQTYILDNYNLDVNLTTTEEIKNKVASLYQNDMFTTDFLGIDNNKQFVKKTISASEVRVAILEVYNKIMDLILEYIKGLPTELSAEVFKNGVIFSGGGAVIQGLFEYASEKLEMPVIILDNPIDAVVLGCAKLLDKPIGQILKISF